MIYLKRLVVFCLFVGQATFATAAELPTTKPERVGMSSERLIRIDQAMMRHIEAGHIQGAVAAVARRGKVVHFKSYGMLDEENQIPMPRDSMHIMMSSTKPVLGVAAMMMVEEGLIRTGDPISMYLPEFKKMNVAVLKEPADEDISPRWVGKKDKIPEHRLVPAEREITIHHLLTHTSGLASGGLGSAKIPRKVKRGTLAEYVTKLAQFPLDFQPGSRWAYSGTTALDVVARIIEIVSGQSYDEFLQERIFDRLDMRDTHYNVPDNKFKRRVAIRGSNMDNFRTHTDYFSASFGLVSTARDYLRFEQMLVNGGTLMGTRLLGPRTVKMMSSNQVGSLFGGGKGAKSKGPVKSGFGYTVAVILDPIAADSRRSAGSFGWGGAFGTVSWSDPVEELTAVLMLQQPHRQTQVDFENAIRQAIID
jgi:CubicO group peptidase (beta-lactamase class C family)